MSSFSKTVSWYQDIGKRPTGALKQYDDEIDSCISEILEMGTIFRLDEEINNTLLNTDSNGKFVPSPFNSFFIESEIKLNSDITINGILVKDVSNDTELIDEHKKRGLKFDGQYLILYHVMEKTDKNPKGPYYNHVVIESYPFYNTKKEIKDLFKKGMSDWDAKTKEIVSALDGDNMRAKVGDYVLNFLNLINNPEISLNKREFSNTRINSYLSKNGELKNKKDYYIKISEKVRRYIYEFNNNVGRITKSKFMWIVRGHWMEFRNERYKNKQGQKTWIYPYVKGLGEFKKKDYLVSNKKKIFYNQMRMESIVKDIFPSQFILTNTRAFLDGLEIDCYIPKLKIGFEYDGEQHYNYPNIYHKTKNDFRMQQQRDIDKRQLAEERGITIITIRYDEELSEELIQNKIKDKQFKESQVMEEHVKVVLLP